ncbi:DUF1707 SHOCT-like domain-containing protein [Nonomuraea sp. SBT364]|uniref:DUF1707 SHOCT-like domain-containing protein n=1 Tax=Nonomuraea sp. SBT364 TaxID=1580530 RepID=UPI00066B3CE0|nr:DUF1707 domain-containing protein [Nonomuraea sp. SBT364]
MSTRQAGAARVSDDDRDTSVQLLQDSFADGRLTAAELERRLEGALTARSRDDLLAMVSDLPVDVVHLTPGSGRIRREGDWRVPRLLRIDSVYDRVRLDLSRALVRHSQVDIELRLTYGSATIVLPAGASADVDGVRTEWGGMTSKAAAYARPGELHVRVAGELTHGRLTVRNSRR